MAPNLGNERAQAIENVCADLRIVRNMIKNTEDSLSCQKRRARSLEREFNRLTRSESAISLSSLSSRVRGRDTSSSSSSSYRRDRCPRSPDHRRPRSPLPPSRTPQSPRRIITYRDDRSNPSKRHRSTTPSCSPARRSSTASPSPKRRMDKTPPRPRSSSRSPSPTPSQELTETLPSGGKLPPSLVGRLTGKVSEPLDSTDPSMQMILSAEEKQEIEAITENQEKAPGKTPDQRKHVPEKGGAPQDAAEREEIVSRKAETPGATPKKKDTASEKAGTPKTDQKDKTTTLPKIPKKTPLKTSIHEIWLIRREPKAVTTTQGDQSKAEREYVKERVKGWAGVPRVTRVQAAKDKKSFRVKIELTQKYPLKHMIPIWKEDAEFQIREHVTPVESNKTQKEK